MKMLNPQSSVNPQVPAIHAKRHREFDIFTTLELVAHRASKLEA
jgi:hypothetical protein